MISGGKVMRLPTEKPKTAQAARIDWHIIGLAGSIRSAAAWLTIDTAVDEPRIEAVDDHAETEAARRSP